MNDLGSYVAYCLQLDICKIKIDVPGKQTYSPHDKRSGWDKAEYIFYRWLNYHELIQFRVR